MSLRELADAADCTHTAVAKMERGEFEPSPQLRSRLADALGADQGEATAATFPDRFSEDERPMLMRWLSGET
jgi:transcriptional regulator with XRE-family HTH domain